MDGVVPLQASLGSLLRGKVDGRLHFGLLCSALSGAKPGSAVRLDFRGVEDLSASWIAAAVLPLLPWSATPEIDLYPVLTGVLATGKKWEDEFELVATRAGVVFIAEGDGGRGQLLGALDPILVDTLRAVQAGGEVTGAGLWRQNQDQQIGATAWSNRLKDLHTKRLVRRVSRGREQVYSAVLEVNFDGAAGSGIARS